MDVHVKNASERFARQVEYVKVNGFPGLCSDLAELSGVNDHLTIRYNKADCDEHNGNDELVVTVPFAGSGLTVRLLFYPHEPWMAPDISFTDEKFQAKLTVQDLEDQVPSLSAWSSLEDDIIAQLLHQLMQLYKRYQMEKLENEDVLQYVYESLIKTLGIGEGDIEILVGSLGLQYSSLLVRMPLSLQDVPPVLVDANIGPATSLIQATFQGKDGIFIPKLYLSPRVEGLIGGSNSLALPGVPPGCCLTDYVQKVLELLEQRVRRAVLNFETRKQFVAQIVCQFGSAVIEYDAERFTKIVLLFEVKDFHFLTFIKLGPLFPIQQPTITLQSLYHNGTGEPYAKDIPELCYNSQWGPEEMVRQVKKSIEKHVSSFQMASIQTAS